ncbi:MAG: M20/M25/M40 family metallo-hydrolase [Pseudomonadota bacterium]
MKKSRLIALAAFGLAVAYYFGAGRLELARIVKPLPNAPSALADGVAIDREQLLGDVRKLASVEFAGRKTGSDGSRKTQAFLQERFAALGLQMVGASYVHPFTFEHKSVKALVTPGRPFSTQYTAANVIGQIRGSQYPERYLVVSAHYDHFGTREGKLYPGADDNASGVAAMLAIAAYFKAHPPLHSVLFAAFDGEEMGLHGAKAFVAAPPVPLDKLVMDLNMDMVSHNEQNEIFASGTSYTPALKPLVEQAAKRATVKLMLGHDRPMLVAGNVEDWTDSSDHGPFHDAGIPFLYFGVEDHADYHAPSDTFEHINQDFFAKVAALLVDTAVTLDRNLETVRR